MYQIRHTNIHKIETFHALNDKATSIMRRHSEHQTTIVRKFSLKTSKKFSLKTSKKFDPHYKTFITRWIFDNSDATIKIKPSCYKYFSTLYNMWCFYVDKSPQNKIWSISHSKFWKATWNAPEHPVDITQKLATETTGPYSSYCYIFTIML